LLAIEFFPGAEDDSLPPYVVVVVVVVVVVTATVSSPIAHAGDILRTTNASSLLHERMNELNDGQRPVPLLNAQQST
jgi:hypothetical protein